MVDLARVVVLAERLEGGGAERLTVELAIAAARRGHSVTVIATAENAAEQTVAALEAEGVTVHALSVGGARLWMSLLRLVCRDRFDLMHAHVHRSNWRGAVISTLVRVPVFIATEHSWSYEGRVRRRLRDRFLIARFARAFVAVSEADGTALSEVERIPTARLVVIPNGVEPEADPGCVDEILQAQLGRIRETAHPLIGTVCYLRRQKALHVLIEAVVLLRRSLPGAELVLVGDGPLGGELTQLVIDLQAGHFIHFLGHSHAPRSLLKDIDLFAMSSAFEGTPYALLDAMAERRPIVATAVGGVPELVPHRVAALLVDPGSPSDLAAALLELAQNDELRGSLAGAAADRAQLFSQSASIIRWFDLYDSLWSVRDRTRTRKPGRTMRVVAAWPRQLAAQVRGKRRTD